MALFSKKVKPASPTPGAGENGQIGTIGTQMLRLSRGHKAGLLSSRFYSDKLMNWSMRDHDFKVQLFRFVDVFPMLKTPEQVHDHLADYMSQPGVTVPAGLDMGLKASGIAKGLAAKTISGQIASMAGKFIAGVDAQDAAPKLKALWDDGIAFSVDLLGEACVSGSEADMYRDRYLDLVRRLPREVGTWKTNARLEHDHLGPIPRTNVSIKISSLSARADAIDTQGAIADIMGRLVPILETARDEGVFINFDIEQFALKELTFELFMRCCEQVDFHAGVAMQAYLKSGVDDAKRIADWARSRGRTVTVRLVKGAYWDYETIHAEEMGWPCPVWNEKWQTDVCFERMSDVFLDATPRAGSSSGGVKLALGSHNVRSIAHALAGLSARGLAREAIELQMLHGMADQLKHAATQMGLRVREYVPVGEMIPGMAYLVRRLLENTSNESWLKAGFLDNADPEVLLADPARCNGTAASAAATDGSAAPKPDLREIAPERHQLSPAPEGVGDGRPFMNEPTRDFADARARDAFAKAVNAASVPHVENDRTPDDAIAMVARAQTAFDEYGDTDVRARAGALISAAATMRARRDELAGVMIKEAGKTWREADADVCEAIDFCEYYARCAVELFERRRLGRFIGELDEVWHQPRGVSVVISPWNFPLAIACGMTAASLVCANPTILKPAEQTPGIAKLLCEALWEGLVANGISKDALQFCPAPGETTGAALVRDPRVALLAFTGSKAVGLDIIEAAGHTPAQQAHVKKVVCEMGGKNAIVVDTSADLDEAVVGIRHSAFGFQGQKCSACSRIIVVDPQGPTGEHMRMFLTRFVEATRSLVVGDPVRPGTDVGPVIDEEAAAKIRRAIAQALDDGCTLELGDDDFPNVGELNNAGGGGSGGGVKPRTYIAPHIFSGVRPEHAIAREEIFGPVVGVMHAHTFDDALAIANGLTYKLTGAVFTRKPSHITKAKARFRVGNLYINRGSTGALVARQPFGGFGLSGVGSKAGGSEYLLQFVEPRACCENTMRRGFAPEL